MKNISAKQIFIAILVVASMSFLNMCNSCTSKNNTKRILKEQDSLRIELVGVQKELNDIKQTTISENEMKDIIKETPAWKTLRIEEISDKEHISINALEEKE